MLTQGAMSRRRWYILMRRARPGLLLQDAVSQLAIALVLRGQRRPDQSHMTISTTSTGWTVREWVVPLPMVPCIVILNSGRLYAPPHSHA